MVTCLIPPSIDTLIPLINDLCSHLHSRKAGVVSLNLLRQCLPLVLRQQNFILQDKERAQETADMQADHGKYHAHATTAIRPLPLLLLLRGIADGWSSWNGNTQCTVRIGV